jgi:enterochelin esterase family protein
MDLREHRLRSDFLDNERSLWMLEAADPEAPADLVIFLDGEYYRDGVDAPSVIDRLQADGLIGNTLAVFVSMESVASRWIECPCHAPFAAFVVDECLPWIESQYPDLTENRVIVGLSYTGLAAAFTALSGPGKFSAVIAQSGSFWWNENWLDTQIPSVCPSHPTRFYLSVGSREVKPRVEHKEGVIQRCSQIEGVERFHRALTQQGYVTHHTLFDGGHDFLDWRKDLGSALRWALGD